MQTLKKLSVIIPNLNSPTIGQTLQSLRNQDCEVIDMEIIVVGMDKYHLVESDELVRFLETTEPLCAAAARNLGIVHSEGDVLAFIDADCIVSDEWLKELIAHYEDPGVCALVGSVDFPTEEYWTLCDNLSTFYDYHVTAPSGERLYAPTLNFSVRREVLDQVGLFDESFPGAAGEDIDLTLRIRFAGYSLTFDPNIVVYHHPAVRNSFLRLIQRSFTFGRNMIKVFWRYSDRRKLSFFHRYPLLLLLFSPFLAVGVTLKMFLGNIDLCSYWHTIPIVLLAKLAWRIGGAYQAWKISSEA
jgi:cellulose synthase/poly-beta-1,6-N-acetylglucosamine synthase-like glycosyltransferase